MRRLPLIGMLALLLHPHLSAAAEPDDPYYHSQGSWQQQHSDQWAVRVLGVFAADAAQRPMRAPTAAPTAPIVAVIDTGIDLQHEDLALQRLWRNEAEVPNGRDDDHNGYVDDLIGWNFVDHNNRPDDRSGHGTHVAGLIGACTNNGVGIAAVAPNARIMPLKVAHFAGQARSVAIAAAIDYASRQGADIINLSMTGTVATLLEAEAVQRALVAGALVVVSAGNEARSAAAAGLAGLPGVLVVSASTVTGERAEFSNFGPRLDVLAPGVDVLSLRASDSDFIALTKPVDYEAEAAVVGEQGQYYRASGTSFSAALVSGVAASLLARRSDLSAGDLKTLIRQGATDVLPAGVDQGSGYGLVSYEASANRSASQFVDARISKLSLQAVDEQVQLLIHGVATADTLGALSLSIAPRSGALRWQSLTLLPAPDDLPGVIGAVDLESVLAMQPAADRSGYWLRLRVERVDGSAREARMAFALPGAGGPDT